MATANERLRDFQVARQISLLRLSETEASQVLAILRDSDDALARRLERVRRVQSFTARRLRVIREDIRAIIQAQTANIRGEITTYVRELAEIERNAQVGALARSVNAIGLETATPRIGVVVQAIRNRPMEGRPLSRWVDLLGERDFDRVWATTLRGLTIGQTNPEIVRAVVGSQGLRFTDGVRQVTRRAARTVVRTTTTHTAAIASEAVWRENADLIDGIQWVSTLDGRTSSICQARDGQVFDVDEGPRPPAHMNCRSTTAPVLKSARALGVTGLDQGTRAAFDGQVPESLTYQTWLQGRSAAFQDDVLGPTRGKLFREGDLTLDRFVNFRTGEAFSLDELRRREPAAFIKAGLTDE